MLSRGFVKIFVCPAGLRWPASRGPLRRKELTPLSLRIRICVRSTAMKILVIDVGGARS